MPLSIGPMRHRLTLQFQAPPVPDAFGQPATGAGAWITVGTYWGRVEPLSGREIWNARQMKATSTHKITMRNVGPISSTARFLFQGGPRLLNIDAILRADERNEVYLIMATETNPPR